MHLPRSSRWRLLLCAVSLLSVDPNIAEATITKPSPAVSAQPDGDFDGDGLTNAEELARGSDPNEDDTDGDGVTDSQDGWPRHDWITQAALPKTDYAVARLRAMGFPATAQTRAIIDGGELNDRGDVLGYFPVGSRLVFWSATTWTATELPMTRFDRDEWPSLDWSTNLYYDWPGTRLGENGQVLGQVLSTQFTNRYHATAWSEQTGLTVLDNGDFSSCPIAVNSVGTVIGFRHIVDIISSDYSTHQYHREIGGWVWGQGWLGDDRLLHDFRRWPDYQTYEEVSGTRFMPFAINEEGLIGGVIEEADISRTRSSDPWSGTVNRWAGLLDGGTLVDLGTGAVALLTGGDQPLALGGEIMRTTGGPGWSLPWWARKTSNGAWVREPLADLWLPATRSSWTPSHFRSGWRANDRFEMIIPNDLGGTPPLLRNGILETVQVRSWSAITPIDINNHGVILASAKRTHDEQGLPIPSAQQVEEPVMLIPATLSVDANRDGSLDDKDVNATSASSPFRFWSNVDDDVDAIDAVTIAQTAGTDWQNNRVDGADDLADIFPLFLDIRPLLTALPPSAAIRYKLKQADGGLNFAYTSLTRATAFDYLTDTASTYGLNADQAAANVTTQQITAAGAELPAVFLDRVQNENQGVILLELRRMTAAPLRLVVEKNGAEIAEVAINIATGEIEWESLYADNPVEDFKVPAYYADYTAKPLKWIEGLRYFSDGADKNATFHRTRINVKVKMAGAAGKSVKLKAFDVDDPTPSEWDLENVVDPNDAANGAAGGDNDTTGVFASTFATSSTDTITTTLDGNGEATVEFITTQKPGANYRIAAVLSAAAGQLDALQVTNADAAHYFAPGAELVRGFTGVSSPTLTIWRKLHIEVDSMAAAPDPIPENLVTGTITSFADDTPNYGFVRLGLGLDLAAQANQFEYGDLSVAGVNLLVRSNSENVAPDEFTEVQDTIDVFKDAGITAAQLIGQSFTLTEDDNRFNDLHGWQELPLHDAHAAVLQPVRAKYAPAFIEIIDANAAGLNENLTVTFKLNESAEGHAINIIPDVYNDALDVGGTEFFWAHAVVFGLQPKTSQDGDPYAETQYFGGTPFTLAADGWVGLGYSAIYIEIHRERVMFSSMQDLIFNPTTNFFATEAIEERAVFYRNLLYGTIAHEIGHGPTIGPDDDHNDGGLMGAGGDNISVDFSAASIRRFRSTNEWK
jgi:hypothetical protein